MIGSVLPTLSESAWAAVAFAGLLVGLGALLQATVPIEATYDSDDEPASGDHDRR